MDAAMSAQERAALYRQRAAEVEQKAATARTENMQRAWLILARDWQKMAAREELKFLVAAEVRLSPEQQPPAPVRTEDRVADHSKVADTTPIKGDDFESAIRMLAAQSHR